MTPTPSSTPVFFPGGGVSRWQLEGSIMAGSTAEREVRDYAAGRLRQMLPDARIIHELAVGGCRADLAAVEPDRVVLVEIKSERDTLKRLAEQVRQFKPASHLTIVVAHERWWDATPYDNGRPRCVPSDELRAGADHALTWCYPEIVGRYPYGSWSIAPFHIAGPQPHAARLLELLWKEELLREAHRHGIAAGSRTTCPTLVRDMAWHMTGKEIAHAVCRQLRQRAFPEADAPMIEAQAA